MMVKQQLIAEIEAIDNPTTLAQFFEVLQLVKQNILTQSKQRNPVMQFAGCLDDDDAQAMRTTIDNEFNKIETNFFSVISSRQTTKLVAYAINSLVFLTIKILY